MQFFAFYVFFVVHKYSAMIKWNARNTKERKTLINIKALCDRVRQTSYDIHEYHGHGHLEKVYENALAHRLRKAGLHVAQQHPIKVYDADGTLIGDFFCGFAGGCLFC